MTDRAQTIPIQAPHRSPPRFATLVLLSWLAVLSLNLFVPSLGAIADAFEADYGLVSLSIAGYLVVVAGLQLILGPLSDRFGRRPVMLGSLGLYTLASLGCTLADNVWVFLGFRLMQGVIAAGWMLSLAIIRDTSEEGEAASRIGYITMAMAIAPMVGPMLGGLLEQAFGWRASFVFYTLFGATMFTLCWFDLGETNRHRGMSAEERMRGYRELFGSRRFWGYALCMMFSTGTFYAFLAGAPLVAQARFDLSPALLGIALGVITAGFMAGSFVSGRYSRRVRLTTMIMAGRVAAALGPLAALALFAAGVFHPAIFFGASVLVGFGNGLTTPNCSAGAMSVRPALAGSASGLAGSLTVSGGAALTAITGALVTEANGPQTVMAIILFCIAMGMAATAWVMAVDRAERLAAGEGRA